MDQITTFLEKEWPVITGAPVLSILLLVAGLFGGWLIKKVLVRHQIDAFKAQKEAAEGRLQLVSTKLDDAEGEKTAMETTIAALQRQIEADASRYHALAGTSASVEHHVIQFDKLWTDVKTTIAPVAIESFRLMGEKKAKGEQ